MEITITEYLSKFGISENIPSTLEDLREYMDNNGLGELWDYPLDELDEIEINGLEVVMVTTGNETRYFEV